MDVDDKNVHTEHCCVTSCKYGDHDCPVATGLQKPSYPCEDCCCELFHPDLIEKAEKWWKNLSDVNKRAIYHFERPISSLLDD